MLECDGVYIEKHYTSVDFATLDKAYGKVAMWGGRRRAFIATGDNRNSAWERLGTHECWIKLGENTIEAIRQALLADEARVCYVAPAIPSERIVALTVLSSLTGPEPMTISLNDGFNAIIGGRGSGKSALLEYLRFGLGRTDRDLPRRDNDRSVSAFDRDAQLIADTLGERGFVDVKIEREGITETWRRDIQNKDLIIVFGEDGSATQLVLSDAQRRFPARAFAQKGLSTTMRDNSSAAEQITSIAAAEQLDKRREIDAAIDTAKRQIGTAIRRLSAYWQVQLERRRAQSLVADLKHRIAAVAARLEKEGLQKDALAIIADATLYDRARNYQAQVNRARITDTERLNAVKKNFLHVVLTQFEGIEAFPEIKQLDEAIDRARESVSVHLDAAVAEMAKLRSAYEESLEAFAKRDNEYQSKLNAAMLVQTAHKQLLDEHARLTGDLQKAEARALEIVAQEDQANDAPEKFASACAELDRLIAERGRVLALAAHHVEGQSSRMLKAKRKFDPCPQEYVDAVCSLMNASQSPRRKR